MDHPLSSPSAPGARHVFYEISVDDLPDLVFVVVEGKCRKFGSERLTCVWLFPPPRMELPRRVPNSASPFLAMRWHRHRKLWLEETLVERNSGWNSGCADQATVSQAPHSDQG